MDLMMNWLVKKTMFCAIIFATIEAGDVKSTSAPRSGFLAAYFRITMTCALPCLWLGLWLTLKVYFDLA